MENYSFLLYVFCIIIIFLIGKFFIVPIKKLIKLCVNSAIGAVLIYVINMVGVNYNFHIGLNLWTILCTGFLGIPGVILILLIKIIV